MNDMPPIPICVSYDDQENDDCSEVTWTSSDYETVVDCPMAVKRATDPNYHNKLDGTHPSQTYHPRSSSLLDRICASTDIVSLEEKQFQELVRLKLQVAQQKEMLDLLSSKLSQSQVENKALEVEKILLSDELALARCAMAKRPTLPVKRQSPPLGIMTLTNSNEGSMQMLSDTNAKLVAENARLQAVFDFMQKSFQSHIKLSQKISRADKQTIKTLYQKNALQGQKLSVLKHAKLDMSECTAETSLESDDMAYEIQDSLNATDDSQLPFIEKDAIAVSSPNSTPCPCSKLHIPSEDTTTSKNIVKQTNGRLSVPIITKETENCFTKGAVNRKPEELLVDFGETRRFWDGKTGIKPTLELRRWANFRP